MGRISHFTMALSAALRWALFPTRKPPTRSRSASSARRPGLMPSGATASSSRSICYLDQNNGKNGNPTVEVIFRDVGGDNPPRARQLAQEMIVNDHVAIMGGLEFTTTVLAVADVINQAKMPFVFFNSATSVVTDKSPYYIRASFTQWQTLCPARTMGARAEIQDLRDVHRRLCARPGRDRCLHLWLHQGRRQDARSDPRADEHDGFLELFPARP